MDILFASVIGYFFGSTSVLLTIYLLSDRSKNKAVTEEIANVEEVEISADDKLWMEQMQALWNYDGKGGDVSGDKENAGASL